MASKRRIRRRSCECKKPYTKDEAEEQAWKLRKRGVIVFAYFCQFKKHWHIGHRPYKIYKLIEQNREHRYTGA